MRRLSVELILSKELLHVIYAMFPDPVDSLSGFVTQIARIEVTAKKQRQVNRFTLGLLQLTNLRCLLFSSLISVREVTSTFGLDQHWVRF